MSDNNASESSPPPSQPAVEVPAAPETVKKVISIDDIPKGFLYRFEAWGKPFWNVLHAVTFTYPEKPAADDKERIIAFFSLIPFYLPCSICGMHFARELAASPLTDEVLASTEPLARWLVDLHNKVNARLKKPLVSFESAKKFYFQDYTVDPRDTAKISTEKPAVATSGYKTAFGLVSILAIILLIIIIVKLILPRCLK